MKPGAKGVPSIACSPAGTVLLVGGSLSLRQTVAFALGNAGYRVIIAATGKDALNELDAHGIQAVITDSETDEMNVPEFIQHLRNRPGHRFTPVVMLASELHTLGAGGGDKTDVSTWVIKPFTPEQLIEVLKGFLC